MDAPADLTVTGYRGYYRPHGEVTLRQLVDLVDGALAYACAQGIREMLIDLTGVTGFPTPDVFERYEFASRWAGTVVGRVRAAFIPRPEQADPDKFGVIVAGNRGFDADLFFTEADAIAWLDSGERRRASWPT